MLAGRAVSELAQVVLGLVVFTICGLVVGWQPHGSPLETAAAYALLVLWAFAGVWNGTLLGMFVRDAESAQTVGFTVLFPMMFLSAIFVPIAGLPAPLKQIAEWNPLSAVAGAMRELFHNPSPVVSEAWPLVHPHRRDDPLVGRAHRGVRAARGPALPPARVRVMVPR